MAKFEEVAAALLELAPLLGRMRDQAASAGTAVPYAVWCAMLAEVKGFGHGSRRRRVPGLWAGICASDLLDAGVWGPEPPDASTFAAVGWGGAAGLADALGAQI